MSKDNDEVRTKFRKILSTTTAEVEEYKKSITQLLEDNTKLNDENKKLNESIQKAELKTEEIIEQNKADMKENDKKW